MLRILLPIPNSDFDPTEVAVTWSMLRAAGHIVDFATPDGKRGYADPMMISGEGLDPWGWIPLLKKLRLVGLLLRANRNGRDAHRELLRDPSFLQPKRHDELRVADYDGLVLAGGHAQGMKPYLESKTLQMFVAKFFDTRDAEGTHKPVAAICHGVVLASRSISAQTNRSVLYGLKTTALTWKLERSAWQLSKYFARFWDANYYRTYRESNNETAGYWSVEQEVKRALASEADFQDVSENSEHYFLKTNGITRDTRCDFRSAWVVRDGNYVSARWPGDVHAFAQCFLEVLAQYYGRRETARQVN